MAQFQNHMSLKRKHIRIHSQIVHKWIIMQFKDLRRWLWDGDRRVGGTDGASKQLVRTGQALVGPLLLSGCSGGPAGGPATVKWCAKKRSSPQKGGYKISVFEKVVKIPRLCAESEGKTLVHIFSRRAIQGFCRWRLEAMGARARGRRNQFAQSWANATASLIAQRTIRVF